MSKTTKKDFELFKRECEKWIEFFGLKEYRIEFFHEDIGQTRGQTDDYDHLMVCDIKFPKELHSETDNGKIKMAAFHEVCEVMLIRVRRMADEYYAFDRVNREIHTIIRKLENSIYKALAKK